VLVCAVVSRDRLIDALWGERPPPTASHTLDAYVSRLRKALASDGDGGARLVTLAPGYVLRLAPDQLDLACFERPAADGQRALDAGEPELAAVKLRQAAALWRGRPLADVEFEPFARAYVDRLEQLGCATTEQRVEAELALGRHDRLVPELQALVSGYPLRERLRGQLMLALYRSGRQAEALAVYQEGRVLLREELGVDPGPQLQELERAVLRQDPALAAPSAHPPSGPTAAQASPITPARAARAPRRWVAVTGVAVAAILLATVGLAQRHAAPPRASATVDGNAVVAVDTASRLPSAPIALRARPAAAAYGADGIAGANECQARPTTCDLSNGIVTDEATRRVTFHLSAPDRDRDIVDQAPWLPTVTPTWTDFISKRTGNYQFHPLWGILIDQLWVR
jgi:DNA-binding SARP family transcriptional activator